MRQKKKSRNLSYKEDGEFITFETFGAPHDLQTAIHLKGNTLATIACTLLASMGGELCQI